MLRRILTNIGLSIIGAVWLSAAIILTLATVLGLLELMGVG